MAQTLRDVMTNHPVTLPPTATLSDAALAMRDADIGDVIVADDGAVRGIATDRDIVVRAVAQGLDPRTTTLGEVCSQELTTVSPETSVTDAVAVMREKAIRRLPVVEVSGEIVGVVSIGDLAEVREPDSALAEISAQPPNN